MSKKYQCEYCGHITSNQNEWQCPVCKTMDSLHEIVYNDDDDDDFEQCYFDEE